MRLIIVAFFVLSFNQAISQKIVDKITKETCKCIEAKIPLNDTSTINQVTEECMLEAVTKYKKAIEKEYGEGIIESSSENAHDFGMTVGKVLVSNCDVLLNLIVAENSSEKNNEYEFFKNGEEFSRKGQYDDAIESYNKAIAGNPTEEKYFNSRGVAYFNKEKYYEAIGDFLKAIELKKDYNLAHYNMAYSKYKLSDFDGVLETIDVAINIDGNYCDSYNLKGLVFYNRENYDSAVYHFSMAYECDPTKSIYSENVGVSHYNNEKYVDAIPWLEQASKLDSNKVILLSYLGNSYEVTENYDKAIKTHTKHIIATNSKDYIGFYNRGYAYFGFKEYEKALADFQQAYRLDSTDVDISIYIAKSYDRLDQLTKAGEFYTNAVKLNPQDASNYDNRAAYYRKIGENELAIQDYLYSLNLYPDDCEIHRYLGEIYKEIGNIDKSKESFNKSYELGCKNEE